MLLKLHELYCIMCCTAAAIGDCGLLLVAYMRTSLSFKETQSEARERSAGLGLGVAGEAGRG